MPTAPNNFSKMLPAATEVPCKAAWEGNLLSDIWRKCVLAFSRNDISKAKHAFWQRAATLSRASSGIAVGQHVLLVRPYLLLEDQVWRHFHHRFCPAIGPRLMVLQGGCWPAAQRTQKRSPLQAIIELARFLLTLLAILGVGAAMRTIAAQPQTRNCCTRYRSKKSRGKCLQHLQHCPPELCGGFAG